MMLCFISKLNFPTTKPDKTRKDKTTMVSLSTTIFLPSLSKPTLTQKPTSKVSIFNSQNTIFLNKLPLSYNFNVKALQAVDSSSLSSEAQKNLTLRDICKGHIPESIISRMEELGYIMPTDVQLEGLPVLFSGSDCVLHAQTGSGKTLTYLLLIFSAIKIKRSSVQALIVVPTRELGMQVTKIARMIVGQSSEFESDQKSCTVMSLLDGGMLKRQKIWLKADPPTIVVATIGSLCHMLERHTFKIQSLQVLVIDEVDFLFSSSKQVNSLRKLLTSYSSCDNRQTVFASASIPQHRRFLQDCVQQKWTKSNVVHVQVNPVQPMPSCICHRFVICDKSRRHQTLLSLLHSDAPKSGIIFVNEQSEKSKMAGNAQPTALLCEFLENSDSVSEDIFLLEEDMNINSRAASLSELRQGGAYLLVATDIAARGVDLPETTHIYNFDLPKSAVEYLHRAGRTSRKPFSSEKCFVTSIISSQERFVLQRYENELMFSCEELNAEF